MVIEDQIENALKSVTPVCDSYEDFRREVYEVKKLRVVGDRDIFEWCSRIIKRMKKKQVVIPESMRQAFIRLYVLVREISEKKT